MRSLRACEGLGSNRSAEPGLRAAPPPRYTVVRPTLAGMAELADAKVSKTFERKLMGVRSPLPAPFNLTQAHS